MKGAGDQQVSIGRGGAKLPSIVIAARGWETFDPAQ